MLPCSLISVVIYSIFILVKCFFVQLILFLRIFYYNNIFSVSFDFTVAWYTTLVCRQLSFSGYAGGILFFSETYETEEKSAAIRVLYDKIIVQ